MIWHTWLFIVHYICHVCAGQSEKGSKVFNIKKQGLKCCEQAEVAGELQRGREPEAVAEKWRGKIAERFSRGISSWFVNSRSGKEWVEGWRIASLEPDQWMHSSCVGQSVGGAQPRPWQYCCFLRFVDDIHWYYFCVIFCTLNHFASNHD